MKKYVTYLANFLFIIGGLFLAASPFLAAYFVFARKSLIWVDEFALIGMVCLLSGIALSLKSNKTLIP